MKTRLLTIFLSAGLGLAVWIIDAVLDALVFYDGTFWDLLILNVPLHELYIRLIILALFITFGLIVSGLLAEQAQAKEELWQSQRTFKTLIGNLPGMAYRCLNNREWTMTFVSQGCVDLTGYRPDDLIDDRVVAYSDLVKPEDREAVWSAVQAGVESGEPYQMVYRITTADGTQKWVWEQGEAIPPLDGGELILEGFITDITQRVQAEEGALAAERRYRDTLKNLSLVAVILDPEGRVAFCNDYVSVLTGWPQVDILGRDWFEQFIPSEIRTNLRQLFDKTVTTGEFPAHHENPILTREGGKRLIRWNNTPLHGPDGAITSVASIGEDITERRQAEQALRASEVLNRTTLYSIGDAVITTDSQGCVRQMNPVAEMLTGWREAEAVGKPLLEVFHIISEETRARVENPVERVLEVGAIVGLANHTLLIARDGTEYPIADSGAPIHNEQGEITGVVLVFRDQTEERAAERALRESEEKYRSLFENMLSGFAYHRIVLDEEGTPVDYIFLDVNEAFEQQTGLMREDIIGKRVTEVIPGIEKEGWIERYGRVVLTGEPIRFEQYAEALERWYGVSAYSLQPDHFVTVFYDITERKHAEEALRKSETRYRALAENAPTGIWQLDPEGNTIYANPAMSALVQLDTPKTMMGVHYSEFFSEESLRKVQEELAKRPGGVASRYEVELVGREGRKRKVLISGAPIFTPDGELHSSLGLFIDITEREQAEEALRKSEARLAAFTSTMPDPGFILGEDGAYLEVVGTREDLLAAAVPELKGRRVQDVLPQEAADICLAGIRQALATGEVQSVEYSLDVPVGHRWFEARISPMSTDVVAARAVAFIARDITERVQAEEAERRQRLLAEALRDTAEALHSTLELDEVLDRILSAVTDLVPHSGANIVLVDETNGTLKLTRYCPCYDANDLPEPQLPKDAQLTSLGVYRDIAQTHEPVIISDTSERPGWPVDNPSIQWVRSYLCAPILVDGEIAGFINIDSIEVGAFTPKDKEALVALAGQAAIAIDSARLFEQVREQARYLVSLNQASSRVSRWGLDLDGVLQAIVTTLTEEIGLDFARIWLADKEDETLEVRASAGWHEQDDLGGLDDMAPDRSGWLAQIAQDGKPFLTNNVPVDEFFDREWASERGIVAFAGYPLKKDRRLMAVLTIFHSQLLSGTVLDVMGSFVNQAAIAIENARLYEELEEYSGILEQAVAERTADLERAKEQVESILHHSPDGIVLLKPDGMVETANPAMQAMFGYLDGELVDQPSTALVDPSHSDRWSDVLERARQERTAQRVELLVSHKDGATFDAQAVLGPVIEDGRLIGVVCSLRDITALKEIERIKDDFLATAAHELRTPLTSIRGFSELLLTRDLSHERQERYHRHINDQSTQLANIIDDLLDISRLEAGRGLEIQIKPVRMDRLIAEVVQPFVETTPDHTFRLDVEKIGPVSGDAFRLAQVVRNLVQNAIKYSPGGGLVEIATREREGTLEISVKDTGIGLTEGEKAHLFEKFYRADTTETSGTGLGLVISKLIIEEHGGEIWAESESGVGSTFTFTLPLMDKEN